MPKAKKTTPADGRKAVYAHLKALPKDSRAALDMLREDIKAAAPGAEETIAWRMPAFRQGKVLVCYAAFRNHCRLFPMGARQLREFAVPLMDFTLTKGSIHFTRAHPLPSTLVRRIVRSRLADIEVRQTRTSR